MADYDGPRNYLYVGSYEEKALAYFYADFYVRRLVRHSYKAAGWLAVYSYLGGSFDAAGSVFHADVIGGSAEPAHACERVNACREARVDTEAIEFRPDAEYVLADSDE